MTIKEIEVNILNKMFKRLNNAGYNLIGYHDSEEYFTSNKNDDAINWLYEVDDYVFFQFQKSNEPEIYWVRCRVGNIGFGVIRDYISVPNSEFDEVMKSMLDYSNDLEEDKIKVRTEREEELFKLLYRLRLEAMHYMNTGNGKMFLEKAVNATDHIVTCGDYDDIIYKKMSMQI